ncbi:hypothetical protein IFM89_015731 [Coptis chinensis]|uniref:LIM zinc-binding domain-containing protein n=1 Tax=Coptis chinensis TaxID=261450 RepID=A0A835I0D7_9MAGN|nr:hypothetical protein IFM89_015731 [Coptis chinensis]
MDDVLLSSGLVFTFGILSLSGGVLLCGLVLAVLQVVLLLLVLVVAIAAVAVLCECDLLQMHKCGMLCEGKHNHEVPAARSSSHMNSVGGSVELFMLSPHLFSWKSSSFSKSSRFSAAKTTSSIEGPIPAFLKYLRCRLSAGEDSQHGTGKFFPDDEQITSRFMGWLNKIFKGSSHKISEGQYHGKLGDERIWNEPESTVDTWTEYDNEDIDRAIAESLAEQEAKGKNVIDDEPPLVEDDEQLARALQEPPLVEDDEQLARALQESLNMVPESPPPPPHYGSGSIFQPIPFFSTGFRICAACNREIGHGRYLSCNGLYYHPDCFRCHACNLPISDTEFSMSGNYPYHKSCYKEHYHPKCDVCRHFVRVIGVSKRGYVHSTVVGLIPTNVDGLIEYRAHPFWSQKYCPSHEHDRTPRCCSCERMEPRDTQYISLDDGRRLCLECLDSSIMDTNECQPLYLDIQEFYEGLNMKIEQQVPLLLVERTALNEAMEGEKGGYHHMPETRGLCLSEEQTVSTILRRPRIGAGKVFGMITEPLRLTRRCEVTAILILYGLPRLLTGSILAHEMMHAWLRLKGYRTLRPDVEEGICQVLAHMWLESEIMAGSGSNVASSSSSSSNPTPSKKGTRSQFEKKLGDFFKHQIEFDASPTYGDGFRDCNRAVNKYGLKSTLEHIRLTGTFPY